LRQRIDRGERRSEPRPDDRGLEMFELARTGDCVIRESVNAATATRLRFDPRRIGGPPTRPDGMETSLE